MFTVLFFDGHTESWEFDSAVAARKHGRGDETVRRITQRVYTGDQVHDVAVYARPSMWDVNRVPDVPTVPVVPTED